jgi:hypothetical protein
MAQIDPKDISVVVQGPVIGKSTDPPNLRHTQRCLASVRTHLPGAEIVLSTWKNQDLAGLDYDVLVESDDPGAIAAGYIYNPKMMNNTNRLIASARAGLLAGNRKYALKFRSDNLFENAGFLKFNDQWPKRAEEWKIVKERVLTSTVFARDPNRQFPYPYHPSDFFFFGLKEDVLDMWDIPLANLQEIVDWFKERPRPEPDFPTEINQRYAPEQYIWCTFLRKHGDLDFEYQWDTGRGNIERSELTFANNLVLLTPKQLGIRWLKSKTRWQDWLTLYTHGDWERMYQRFCDPAYSPGPDREKLHRAVFFRLMLGNTFIRDPHLPNKIKVLCLRIFVRAPMKAVRVLTGRK